MMSLYYPLKQMKVPFFFQEKNKPEQRKLNSSSASDQPRGPVLCEYQFPHV